MKSLRNNVAEKNVADASSGITDVSERKK